MPRAVVFLVCAAFVWGAPAYRQVFGGKSKRIPRWEMFSGIGLDVFEVAFESVDRSGKRRPIDRFEVLGYEQPLRAPSSVRLVRSEHDARILARRLCQRLGPGTDLRMRLRDATRRGWRVMESGETNACPRPHVPRDRERSAVGGEGS